MEKIDGNGTNMDINVTIIENTNVPEIFDINNIGGAGVINQPQPAMPVVRVFTTAIIEKVLAVLIWPLCFVYSSMLFAEDNSYNVLFGIFVLGFLIMGEAFYWNRKRTFESWAFMVMTVCAAVSPVFNVGHVWEYEMAAFFTHLFAMYWILCRSGRLAEGKTSHLFLWDGITCFFVMTFKNFPLDVRTIVSIFKRKEKDDKKKVGIVFIAIFVGIILLIIALSYLRNADENYNKMIQTVLDAIHIKFDGILVAKLFLTTFFSMYLYGLFGGCYRETEAQVQHRGDNIKKFIGFFAKVPKTVWIVFICLFSVFYIVFFLLQGSYLFDAFSMTLPKQYTFSQYARKGFGDMCGIMVVNFALLWLALRTSEKKEGGAGKALKIACSVLTGESMVFAVIAMLKLLMYIQAYGFTPLRLQSVWLVVVLLFACICVLISMLGKKKTAHIWFIGSAASLAILCVV